MNQYTEAEKIELLQSLVTNINQNNYPIEFVVSTFHNFDSLNIPIQEIVQALNKEKQFYCIIRFIKSGRIRVFENFEQIYHTLIGMCTLISEINGNEPLIAVSDDSLLR